MQGLDLEKKKNEVQLLSLIDVPPPGQCGADCVTLVSVGCLISNLEHIQEPIKIKSIKIWNHSFKQKSQNQDHRSALIVVLYKIPLLSILSPVPGVYILNLLHSLRWPWWEYPVYKAWFNILFDVGLLPTSNHRDSFHTIIIAWSQATGIRLLE